MARLSAPAIAAAQRILAPDIMAGAEQAAGIPDWPGAYLLLIRLDRALDFELRGAAHRLPAGWYGYGGSARGPGGVGARLRRHLRADKRPHWHVDALTVAAAEMVALAIRDGDECGIVARLGQSGAFDHPVAGFGSSDCRACSSHLLAWREEQASE